MVVNKNLIFIDTETTGFEIGKDRLCQISYWKLWHVFIGLVLI